MITLTWPYGLNSYFANNGYDESGTLINNSSYFKMKKFISEQENIDNIITTNYLNLSSADDKPDSKIFFIDLDEDYTYEEGASRIREIDPLIQSGKPFTIDVTLSIPAVNDSFFYKSRVYFSIGQNISGVGGNIITVGTNAMHDPKKPVIGMITKDGSIKALPIVNALELNYETKYTFRLVHNPSAVGERKLILFLKDLSAPENDFVLQSTANGLSSYHHYIVSKPRLYFYTSGWTNEYGWNNTFDFSYATMEDDASPIQVSNGVKYPDSYIISNLEALEYSEPELSFTRGEAVLYETETGIPSNAYISSNSTLNFYVDIDPSE